jgi:hypothetical protein
MQFAYYMEDVDGDGDGDIFGGGGNIPHLWLQEDGTFVRSEFPVMGWRRGVGDANSDGTFDVFGLHTIAGVGSMEISLNRSRNMTNVLVAEGNAGVFWQGSRFGDLDNDGDLDIASYLGYAYDPVTKTGSTSRFAVVKQLSGDSGAGETLVYEPTTDEFPLREWEAPDLGPGDPPEVRLQNALGDFDNDGDLDIVAIGPDSELNALTFLAKNNQTNPNSAPSAPAGLMATQVEEGVYRLEWQESSDDTTPTDGLTYAVRVGTTPGGADVMPPLALPNGYRQVMRRGNAGSNEFYILNLLKPGTTYYWSVQAIDNTYVGSTFAAEQIFAVMPVANEDTRYEIPDIGEVHLEIFPNPAVSELSISYELATGGHVEISIHDVLGRQVRSVVSGARPGKNTEVLYLDSLPASVYLVTLKHDGVAKSKMITIQ